MPPVDEPSLPSDATGGSVTIRPWCTDDLPETLDCFRCAVRELAAPHYDRDQREAWAAGADDEAGWAARMAAGSAFVAMHGGDFAGFVRAEPSGYIDLLYVHPQYARRGAGRALLGTAIAWCERQGARECTSDVSLAARRCFESAGFVVERARRVERRGAAFTTLAMRRPALVAGADLRQNVDRPTEE